MHYNCSQAADKDQQECQTRVRVHTKVILNKNGQTAQALFMKFEVNILPKSSGVYI